MSTRASTIDIDGFAGQLYDASGRLENACWQAKSGAEALSTDRKWQVLALMDRALRAQQRLSSLAEGARAVSVTFTGAEHSLEALAVDLVALITWMLGPQTATVLGIGAASMLQVPVLRETPVSVHPTETAQANKPSSLEELTSRIPGAGEGNPQIRIERYGESEPVYYVYFGGTIDSGVEAIDEPWDMTSNVELIAGLDAGSQRAAIAAMREAGITATDQVILVGHSQGGLLAARIAESEQYRVSDVVTVGAPIHAVSVPESVQVLAVEHDEDIIPSLSGAALAGATLGAAGSLTISRSVKGLPADDRDPLPAHNLRKYVDTARTLDRSADPAIGHAAARVIAQPGQQGTSTTWRAERIQPTGG